MQQAEMNSVTAGVIIIDKEDNALVIKRDKSEVLFPDLYSIPAGKIILGETIEEAARREVKEEVNLDLEHVIFVDSYISGSNILFVFATRLDSSDYYTMHSVIPDSDFAPNIRKAIEDAITISKNVFDNRSLTTIIQNGIQLVHDKQIVIDEKKGWDHYLFEKRIGIIGSAIGLKILNLAESNISLKEAVVSTIVSLQKSDGGWGFRGADNVYSIVESTCHCLSAIYEYDTQRDNVLNAIEWLITNRLRDHSWGVNTKSNKGRITPTCLAIDTLFLIDREVDIYESIKWLLESVNSDGGWGFFADSESRLSSTSDVIILLSKIDNLKYKDHIVQGCKWLKSKMSTSLLIDEAEQEYVNSDKRFEFKHSTKVKVIKAMLIAENDIYNNNVYKLLKDVIGAQNSNGAWEHSLTSNNFPIWHLYDILDLFNFIVNGYDIGDSSSSRKTFDQKRIERDLLKYISKLMPNISPEALIQTDS